MQFLERTVSSPAENLALDDALLLAAESGQRGEVLRLWEWPQLAVVLGSGSRLDEDVEVANCFADGVPILRRASGGGTVLLGRGCLLFSLVLAVENQSELREIPSSYAWILSRLRTTLSELVSGIELAGTSDLCVNGRKFSGNAQQRKRSHILHHGSILYDFETSLVGRYLRQPVRQPEYRSQRDHAEFLANLPIRGDELRRRLRSAWRADTPLLTWPDDLTARLVAEKYTKAEWVRRR